MKQSILLTILVMSFFGMIISHCWKNSFEGENKAYLKSDSIYFSTHPDERWDYRGMSVDSAYKIQQK